MIKVYAGGSLAGQYGNGDGGAWRKKLPHINGVEWLIPAKPPEACKENNFRSEFYAIQDLSYINASDILLFVFEEGATVPQHGTCTEVGIGYAKGIPMVAVCPDEEAKTAFGFALRLVNSVVRTLDEAIEIVRFAAGEKR